MSLSHRSSACARAGPERREDCGRHAAKEGILGISDLLVVFTVVDLRVMDFLETRAAGRLRGAA